MHSTGILADNSNSSMDFRPVEPRGVLVANRPSLDFSSEVVGSTSTAGVHDGPAVPAKIGVWQKCFAFCMKSATAVLVKMQEHPTFRSRVAEIWLAGAVLWMGLQIVRAVRFRRRVMRDVVTSAELQQQTRDLGRKLGLQRVPQVLIVRAVVSPMLWGCGSRAKLLFPMDLVERLHVDARATLLTHELVHYTRGDHWVRLLELIATGLFWWHPVVWWARHQIEESEEECCDAGVVSVFPTAPRQYAEALLDTIDFLCESRQPLPPIASGLGQAHFLRRRLTKIMCGADSLSLTRPVRWTLALCAVVLLPLQPFVFGSASVGSLQRIVPEAVATMTPSTVSENVQSKTIETPAPPMTSMPRTQAQPTPPMALRARASRGAKVWSTAASQDGRFLMHASTARRLTLTDRTSSLEYDLSEEHLTSVAFVPGAHQFVAAGSDGRVTLWNAENGELLRTISTEGDGLRSIAVSPAGDAVAVGGRDGSVVLHDLVTGRPTAQLPSFSSAVNCVRFSPDGTQLAAAVGDWTDSQGEVVLLDVENGRIVTTLDCAASPGAVSFASNEELIVGLWNGHAQLWNLTNKQVVGSADVDKTIVAAAGFSPDNPALLEVTFHATSSTATEVKSPFSLLQEFLGKQ
jgi:beta-lactamase regulating signal transducer with metallopeptidase domain